MWFRVLIVSVLLYVAGLAAHEYLRLLMIYIVGSDGSVTARPWHMSYLPVTIYTLHAQPAQPLDVTRQSIVNLLGPALASVPFAALLVYVREPIPLAALIANIVILAVYAAIGLGAVVLANVALLTTPELYFGVPLAVIVVAVLTVSLASAFRGSRIPE